MRELTTLQDQQQVRRLAAYLAVQAVDSSVEQENDRWIIWLHNDDDRIRAQEILADFQKNPGDVRFENAERKVKHVLKEADRLKQVSVRRQALIQKRLSKSWWHCFPATYVIIGLCIAAAVVCTQWQPPQLGAFGPNLCNNDNSRLLQKLGAATPVMIRVQRGDEVRDVAGYFPVPKLPADGLTPAVVLEVMKRRLVVVSLSLEHTFRSGEYWRLVTPIFIHMTPLHIVFNLIALGMFGMAIEYVRGTWRFVMLCLLLAVLSNVAQLYWAGPFFGGISGVVFGLIGYVWIKGKTQRKLGLALTHNSFAQSMLWLVLCMAGVFGPIANAAHLIGFLAGIAIGGRQALWRKLPFVKHDT